VTRLTMCNRGTRGVQQNFRIRSPRGSPKGPQKVSEATEGGNAVMLRLFESDVSKKIRYGTCGVNGIICFAAG
jgi:hypothetical protein